MADRPQLGELADRLGILTEYTDIRGRQRFTENDTRVRLLSAMGIDASTEELAAAALARHGAENAARLLQPVQVVPAGTNQVTIQANLPPHWEAAVEWHAEVTYEHGGEVIREGQCRLDSNSDHDRPGGDPRGDQRSAAGRFLTVAVLKNLPLLEMGYHRLRLSLVHKGKTFVDAQLLVVAPPRCFSLSDRIGPGRAFGLWTNLYSIQTETNWGIGDISDAAVLAKDAANEGADFIGLSPLHATYNRMPDISPYSPVSRLYRNPIYIDVARVPELNDSAEAKALMASSGFRDELGHFRSVKRIDYAGVYLLKCRILRILHDAFLARESRGATQRGSAYNAFLAQGGPRLVDYAAFSAMDEHRDAGIRASHRGRFPEYESGAVAHFRQTHSREVDFHCFLQFELDRQLAAAQKSAVEAGMRLGLYHDLALGSVTSGSDVWAMPDLFVPGVEVGAPPDDYSDVGQTWGFPPVNPHRLRERRYDYWIELLRASMRHAGMLRLDHVMGLMRQFWVPVDERALQGAYVRYPVEELLAILALESQRNQVVIVGEDLGTVPPELHPLMDRSEIHPSRLMVFERESDGSFRPPHWYHPRALVMASNHDHPPLAGLWSGRDLQIRYEAELPVPGNVGGETPAGEERLSADREVRGQLWAAFWRAFHDAEPEWDMSDVSPQEVVARVYSFLTRTPCRLLGVSLDDLGLEEEPVNLPGVPVSVYPSWCRKMSRALAEILQDPACRRTLCLVRERLRGGG